MSLFICVLCVPCVINDLSVSLWVVYMSVTMCPSNGVCVSACVHNLDVGITRADPQKEHSHGVQAVSSLDQWYQLSGLPGSKLSTYKHLHTFPCICRRKRGESLEDSNNNWLEGKLVLCLSTVKFTIKVSFTDAEIRLEQ